LRQNLGAQRAQMAEETAGFRSEVRADHAAMSDALRHNLDLAQAELVSSRAAMSEQIAEFRANVQMANQTMSRELHTKLGADRAELNANMDKMMAEVDSFLGDIRTDAAGAADAWRVVKEMLDGSAASTAAPKAPAPAAKASPPKVEAVAEPAKPAEPVEAPEPEAPDGDPLVDLNGIGPGTQQRLYAAGIKTFAALANASPDMLRELAGPAVTRRYHVEDWIEEARRRQVG